MKILTVGNFVPRKRIWLAADAFIRMRKEDQTTQWRVIGNGPDEHTHERVFWACYNGAEHSTYVEDLAAQYKWADVFVLPSVDEAFGMVYAEAIAFGCPVVCTAGDGGAWILEITNSGKAVELWGSPKRMVDKLISAIRYIYEFWGYGDTDQANAARTAQTLISPGRSAQQWSRLLSEACPAQAPVTRKRRLKACGET